MQPRVLWLPLCSYFVNLFAHYIHSYCSHPFVSSIFAKLRVLFLSDLKSIAIAVNPQFVISSQYNAKPKHPQMASLPSACLALSQPFLHNVVYCSGTIGHTAVCIWEAATLEGYFLVLMCL
jgi:hypothetical protein